MIVYQLYIIYTQQYLCKQVRFKIAYIFFLIQIVVKLKLVYIATISKYARPLSHVQGSSSKRC